MISTFSVTAHTMQIDEARHIWVWTGNTSSEHRKHMMLSTVETALVPSMLAASRAFIRAELIVDAQLQHTSVDEAVVEARANVQHMALTVDGEHSHLKALEEYFNRPLDELERAKIIHLIKFPAACSKTEQPADVSKCFLVFKHAFKTIGTSPPRAPPAYLAPLVSKVLAPMEAASIRTFTQFFSHLQNHVDDIFTHHNIAGGWAVAGLEPFIPRQLFSQCSAWHRLSKQQGKAALDAIPKLADIVNCRGQLTDEELHAAVGDMPAPHSIAPAPTDSTKKRKRPTKPLHERVLNQRRALWLTCPAFMPNRVAGDAAGPAGGPGAPTHVTLPPNQPLSPPPSPLPPPPPLACPAAPNTTTTPPPALTPARRQPIARQSKTTTIERAHHMSLQSHFGGGESEDDDETEEDEESSVYGD